jgi:O-antigen biosynthesis protein
MRLLLAKNNSVSWHYRCLLPYQELARQEKDIEVVSFSPSLADLDLGWDACILSELDSAFGEIFISECHKRNISTIFDIDDDFFSLLPSFDVYGDFYKRGYAEPTDKLRFLMRNLRLADVVTVTTDVLKSVYLPLNKNILVVPNQVAGWEWTETTRFNKPPNEIWIGWQGTYNHWDDFMVVNKVLTRILGENPNLKLLIAGFPEVMHQFPASVRPQIIAIPFSDDLNIFSKLCRSSDIGIAPLYDCAFNKAKSDLKILQYGIASLCCVASPISYGKTIIHGETGLLAETSDDWYQAINSLINNETQRKSFGTALNHYVKTNRMLENNIDKWKSVLQAI